MISKKTKYTIHALVHLAKHKDSGPIQIKTIAETENIPKKFLEAILIDLRNKGYVASQKGRNGGYYINRDLKEMNFADIIRMFDGPIGMLPCVTYLYYEPCEECEDEETCAVRKIFKDVRDESVKILKAANLAEVIKTEKSLSRKKKK
ncbi:MAG: Rrf2 family transcriptional regulator [Melioribacteraceae bacterium]|nr:Rrf2 family transcriptional regulator [Melioribacteraceae bacterium]MCF8355030.1 Rrf2 family transcriptional regulator [Melioribacteraceae bacterium]MCF8392709.1 Rrf2 family transcriptional regulator [Melioribacteraceae bacterium]MCF8417731.1 Rrf2 family transcriptional regulator [Melioribacteraceae bacterium]